MIASILRVLFTLFEISLGYVIPLMFAIKAYVEQDSQAQNRWLTHFLFVVVLENTLFSFMNLLPLGVVYNILAGVIVGAVFMMNRFNLKQSVFTKVDQFQNDYETKHKEIIRQQLKTVLETLGLY